MPGNEDRTFLSLMLLWPAFVSVLVTTEAHQYSSIAAHHSELKEITPQLQIDAVRLYTWAQSSTSDLSDITVNHPITDLEGSNIMVTTSLSSYQWYTADSLGSIYISHYSDASGDHFPEGASGNALFITDA